MITLAPQATVAQSPATVAEGGWGYAQFQQDGAGRSGCADCGCGMLFDWTPRAAPLVAGCLSDTRLLASRAQLADYAGQLAADGTGVGERWGSLCIECDGAFMTQHWYQGTTCAPQHLLRKVRKIRLYVVLMKSSSE